MARSEGTKFGQLIRTHVETLREWVNQHADEIEDEDTRAELEDLVMELEEVCGSGG